MKTIKQSADYQTAFEVLLKATEAKVQAVAAVAAEVTEAAIAIITNSEAIEKATMENTMAAMKGLIGMQMSEQEKAHVTHQTQKKLYRF